jgi:hypothetical protein
VLVPRIFSWTIPLSTTLRVELRRFGGKSEPGAFLPGRKRANVMQTQNFDDNEKQIDPQIDQAEAEAEAEATPKEGNGGIVPATVPKMPDVVPPGYKLVDPFDDFTKREGREAFFSGDYINFNGQTGRWKRGKNKDEINTEEPFLCHIYDLVVGWIKRDGDGKIPDGGRRLGYVRNGFQPEPREALGDMDERHWPLSRDGKRRIDPWRKITYLPMRDQEGNDVVYGAESDTARRAIAQFVRVVRRSDRGGQEPKVLLGSRSFPNTHGGTTFVPDFVPDGWEFWDGGPEPEVAPVAVPIAPPAAAMPVKALPKRGDLDDDLDDEMPF